MPWAAGKPCLQPGCARLVKAAGYCDAHKDAHASTQNRVYNVKRRAHNIASDKWYHTSAWQKLRASVLAEDPLCRMCVAEGRVTAACLVDHVLAVKQGGDFWSRPNLQPLCNRCHELKSQREGSRGWR